MNSAAALTWFARHEIRLAWREAVAMMTAGRRFRRRSTVIWLVVFVALMHLAAYAVIGRFAELDGAPDKPTLIVITACAFLGWALMLSQAIESVTRVFYARSDLDLIMSSPATLANVFSVRIVAIALTVIAMALLLATPFVNVLVLGGGVRWFAAYGVVIAIGLSAAAVAIAVTVALFRAIGPSRTRLVAQIVAAVIGAGFVIALQIAAILSYGTLSRFAVLTSDAAAAFAPELDSILWWPARAMLGDGEALLCLLAAGLVMLGITMAVFSPRFADVRHPRLGHRGAGPSRPRRKTVPRRLPATGAAAQGVRAAAPRSVAGVADADAIVYLAPPALMLWRSFADNSAAILLITPVIVMAAGQLAGGLAWLTICGEDAADLVTTAPLPASSVTRAKIEVVLIGIGAIFAPLIGALIFASPLQAAVTALGVGIAAASATAIQLWFRVQARRSQFRRRQTSSRLATFAEAFSSIGWAATAALALAWPVVAVVTGLMTAGILAATWKISPERG